MAHPVRKFLETKQYRSADRVLRRVVGRVAGLRIAQENNGGRGGTFAALVACVCVYVGREEWRCDFAEERKSFWLPPQL